MLLILLFVVLACMIGAFIARIAIDILPIAVMLFVVVWIVQKLHGM